MRKFGPRFVALARERLSAAVDRSSEDLALQLHSIAGEAGMMGLAELSHAAREAMGTARHTPLETADLRRQLVAPLNSMLDELERSLG